MERKINYQRKLFSSKTNEVLESLNAIQNNGYPEIIPDIIKVYVENENEEIKQNALFILNNLKEKESVSYFMDGLKFSENSDLRVNVISACWQNGLDFSSYIPTFLNILTEENIETAIEAYSVIESNIPLLSEDHLLELRKKTEELSLQPNSRNIELLLEVKKIL